jgi:F-type H+-transporting ATPase subunit epsilon
MYLEIITPDSKIFEGEIEAVQIPGANGLFEVLTNHAPLLSTISKGKLRIKINGENPIYFNVSGGIVEVLNNKISVLAEEVKAVQD